LNNLLGAKIHWSGKSRKGEKLPEIFEQLKSEGKKPYLIPYGGSNKLGAIGFVEAVNEMKSQLDSTNLKIDHIIFSSSSGGTHAGLTVGKYIYSFDPKFIGIQIDKGEAGDIPFIQHVTNLSNETAEHLDIKKTFSEEEIILREEFMEADYGVITKREMRAIKLLAELEGILLDPVYTGRAFGALIEMIEKNEFSYNENVLFWHTGGIPALFAYSNELLRNI
jgi:L-cysteate sulfo-lyase